MTFVIILRFLWGTALLFSPQGTKLRPKKRIKSMANYTIAKRKTGGQTVYAVRVREKEQGVVIFSKAKTFHSKTAAVAWGKHMVNKVESCLDETDPDLVDCTLGELIDRYIGLKDASNRPVGRTARNTLLLIRRYPISQMLVTKIRPKDVISFCIERKQSSNHPTPQTISIDVSCLRKVLKVAKSIFGVKTDDRCVIDAYAALHDLKLIARSNRRERRLEHSEQSQLLEQLRASEHHHASFLPLADLFELSLITCCRIGELCQIRWDDLDTTNRVILIRDRKSPNGSVGNNCVLPLLGNALDIIERQPKQTELIFPYNSRSVTAAFRRVRKRLGITDLRYHDLRREGASRLIEQGFSVEEAARVTGHKDLKILWNVYVSIKPAHIHLKERQLTQS